MILPDGKKASFPNATLRPLTTRRGGGLGSCRYFRLVRIHTERDMYAVARFAGANAPKAIS